MFEKFMIRRHFDHIVRNLRRSESLPVSPQVYRFFDDWWDEAAKAMKMHKWNTLQGIAWMVTTVAVAGEVSGHNKRIRERDPSLYADLKNLYGFLILSSSKYPEIFDAFCLPHEGHPKPFTISAE